MPPLIQFMKPSEKPVLVPSRPMPLSVAPKNAYCTMPCWSLLTMAPLSSFTRSVS